jgi:hypothetical protein
LSRAGSPSNGTERYRIHRILHTEDGRLQLENHP